MDSLSHLLCPLSLQFRVTQSDTFDILCQPTHPDIVVSLIRQGVQGEINVDKDPFIKYDPKVSERASQNKTTSVLYKRGRRRCRREAYFWILASLVIHVNMPQLILFSWLICHTHETLSLSLMMPHL